jgi:hypothetical protein
MKGLLRLRRLADPRNDGGMVQDWDKTKRVQLLAEPLI